MHIPQTMRLPSSGGAVEVLKKDTHDGASAEWEALFPGGRRKSFFGEPADVRHAVQEEIWRIT
jgi:hypothetical protein